MAFLNLFKKVYQIEEVISINILCLAALIFRVLLFHQFVVISLLFHELRVRSLLDYAAVFYRQDDVRIGYGRQSVSYDKRGPSFGHGQNRILDPFFRDGVDGRSGFVQNEYPGICYDGSRKRDELALSGGKLSSAFSDLEV